jgi:hypothetical protein
VLKVLVFVALLALAIYLVVRTVQRRGLLDLHRPQPRPYAPDDDPDFLRDLDRKRRHPDDPDAV